MKTNSPMRRIRFAATAVAALLGVALPISAGAAEVPPPEALHGTEPVPAASKPFFWPESVLTPDQRARYRAAIERSREQMKEIEARLGVARHELDDAMLAEQFNEDRVREKAAAVATLDAERTLVRARALASVRASLTLEQLEQLRSRDTVPRPKGTPEQREVKRKEMREDLEKRLAAEHDAKRQQLREKVEAQIAELRQKQAKGALTEDERARLNRLENMKKRMESGRD